MFFHVLFENEDFVILNKPSGILVHPTDSSKKENSLINELLKLYPEIESVGEDSLRPGIVHRLDRETSGLLIVAKSQDSFLEFKSLFKKRLIEKTYKALVFGRVKKNKGEFETYIGRSTKDPRRRITLAKPKKNLKTKEAKTTYRVLEYLEDKKQNQFTLLMVKIETGRTHQIRSQFFSINHPLVGDSLYKIKSNDNVELKRVFLHAEKLAFNFKNRYYQFYSPLPQDLEKFLSTLKKCQTS